MLTGEGFSNWQETDASPQSRVILNKDNWLVQEQSPGAGQIAGAQTVIVLKVRKGTDQYVPVRTPRGVVPNVICAELQASQDALRAAGFLVITSTDGTGQHRVAIIDRNWVVIGQSVVPYTSPGLSTHIVLTVVKHGESAGDSPCQT